MTNCWLVWLPFTPVPSSVSVVKLPAGSAMVVNLVPAESFQRATAISSSVREGASIAGPVLGGLLYVAGAATVYASALALILAAALIMMRVHPRRAASSSLTELSLRNALEGLRFIRSRPLVLGARRTARGTEYMLASESVALSMLSFELVRDVAPGEAVFIDEHGRMHSQQCVATVRHAPCIFEYVSHED